MSHIREFAKEHEVQINNFIQDWTADIDGINLKVRFIIHNPLSNLFFRYKEVLTQRLLQEIC